MEDHPGFQAKNQKVIGRTLHKTRKRLVFVNKKKQKNFIHFWPLANIPGTVGALGIMDKSFCLFFSKEKRMIRIAFFGLLEEFRCREHGWTVTLCS